MAGLSATSTSAIAMPIASKRALWELPREPLRGFRWLDWQLVVFGGLGYAPYPRGSKYRTKIGLRMAYATHIRTTQIAVAGAFWASFGSEITTQAVGKLSLP